jgi:thiamine-phosphate pyrophosphorylase
VESYDLNESSTRETSVTDSQIDVLRIIDAAANRTREGLRVVEDFTRFGLDDRHLSQILKECRHELAAILGQLPSSSLLAARDTLNDVGTTITTAAEYQRTSSVDVVRAAFKRVQEALRTLEEYSKVVDASLSPRFEQLRYQLYTTEKTVLRTEASSLRLQDQRVYLLIQASTCATSLKTVVKSALDAGVRIFQLREKSLNDRDLIQQARQVREWTADKQALLIINDRPDIAVLSAADGVHVGQDELTVRDARRIVGPDRFVGVSTHSIEQARQAVLDGADYLGVGPTFPSGTKSFAEFPGLKLVNEVAAEIRLPWFAIGGIGPDNVSAVVNSGANRIAVSGAVCGSPSPENAARQLINALVSPTTSLPFHFPDNDRLTENRQLP